MKTVRFTVYPPDGRVRVAAPLHLSRNQLLQYVRKRIPWIQKQKSRIASMPSAPEYRFQDGEQQMFLGRPRTLSFQKADGRKLAGPGQTSPQGTGLLVLPVAARASLQRRRQAMENLLRKTLKEYMAVRIPFWEKKMGVRVHAYGVRKMKTLWGSCNIRAGRIWLNLDLARRSEACIEAILVHEMVHLKERLHNKRFYAFMDSYLPDWKERERELRRNHPEYKTPD